MPRTVARSPRRRWRAQALIDTVLVTMHSGNKPTRLEAFGQAIKPEKRACGRERRRCHVKGLIAWPKAASLVGLFPECIVTRTVSIKTCARHRRRGDRGTVRGIYKLAYLHAEIVSSHRLPPEIRTKRKLEWRAIKWSCAAATCGSECPLWVAGSTGRRNT